MAQVYELTRGGLVRLGVLLWGRLGLRDPQAVIAVRQIMPVNHR